MKTFKKIFKETYEKKVCIELLYIIIYTTKLKHLKHFN